MTKLLNEAGIQRRHIWSWRAKLAAVIGGLVVGLIVVEVSLRVKDGQLTTTANFVVFRRQQFDPNYGWCPCPPHAFDNERIAILENGLRSNGTNKPVKDRPRVLAVGDSFTFGAGVADNETWPAQLEYRLGYGVLNAGVRGFGFDQAVLRAEKLLPEYKPDGLIVALIPDDIRRCELSYRELDKPFFEIENDEFVLRNHPVIPTNPKLGSFRGLLGYSYLVHTMMLKWASNRWLNLTTSAHDYGEDVAVLLVRRLDDLSQRTGIPVILLIQYDPWEKYSVGALLAFAQPQNVHILDLFPTPEQHNREECFCDNYIPEGNAIGHLDAAGNAKVAAMIARFIERDNLFPRLSRPIIDD